jgi:phage gp29-like protein
MPKDMSGRVERAETPPSSPPAVVITAESMLHLDPDSTIYTGPVIQSRMKNAEYGHLGPQLVMFKRMIENDAHLSSIVQTRRLTVKTAEQTVTPPAGFEDDQRALVAAAYITDLLPQIVGFDTLVPTLIDGPVIGFGARELVWDGVVPVAVLDTPDEGWRWRSNIGLEVRLKTGAWVEVPADKFVIHSPRGHASVLMRRGAMRSIVKWWLIKNIATRDWASFVELFGIPYRKITYPTHTGADDPVVAQVITALQQMGASGVAAVRKDFDLELMSVGATAGRGYTPHEGLVRWCDAQMSKAILGQTLTVDTADATGTYAAAKVHNEVRLDIAQADAEAIGETIKRDLIAPAVGYGLGWDYPVPDFNLVIEDPADEKTRAEVLKIAVNDLGLPVALETAYEELRIREPEEGEDLLEGSETAPTLGDGPAQGLRRRTAAGEPLDRKAAEFRRNRRAAEALFQADEPLGEVPLALETLALLSDREWQEAESASIPEAIARMIRANPELGSDPEELLRRLNVWYINHEPTELVEHIERCMNGAIVNAGLETEAEDELESENVEDEDDGAVGS